VSTRYALDRRTPADIRRALHAAAERSVLQLEDGTTRTWASVLFSGDDWADAAEPSQALLEAFVELQAGLAAHRNSVPGRIQAAWLRERLGIAPLAGVPDRVVVAVTADPARTPLAIEAESTVRAKDSAGVDRRYATAETLTVHGIELIDARSYHAVREPGGPVRDYADRWADRGLPFAPFGGGEPAVHRFILLSDLLAFPDGDLVVRLVFSGGADARALDGAVWEFPAPEAVAVATRLRSSATEIDIKLTGGCTPAPILGTEATYLCASLPAGGWSLDALAFATTGVTVEVLDRKAVRPDAALYNDGRLDPTREMQPFGPAPRRGDAFYVRSDEAFAKPLKHLKIRLDLLEDGDGGLSEAAWSPVSATKRKAAQAKADDATRRYGTAAGATIKDILDLMRSDAEPTVDWQRRDESAWKLLKSSGDQLATVEWNGTTPAGEPFSHPVDPAKPEYYVRAFLAEGDFGWSDYEEGIAEFAAQAAGTGTPDASLLVPPDPPILTSVTLAYKTHPLSPAAVVSEDGWTTRRPPASASYHPFTVPLDLSGDAAGMVAFGLRISATALGKTVSLYFDVESAPACGTGPDTPLEWEYWAGDADWQPLDVADGTLGLRQRGLLRFVAPLDWPEGCPGASAADGRWIRAVTTEPDTVGAILSVIPDAVEAVRVAGEPVSAEPLAAGQVKGFLAAKPGIKKATNRLEGIAGRTPEDPEDPRFLDRAGGAVRHRWRACTAWDHEALVREAFPEIAAVRCLPHTAPDGWTAPGWVGLVLIPRSTDPMPLPGVGLAERVEAALRPRLPVNANLAVLCPLYVPVRVAAEVVLVRGVAAVDARDRITGALERQLHPTTHDPPRFGHELFASTVAAWLESQDDVDHLDDFALLVDDAPVERVAVDPCRGLTASAGSHRLVLEERL
jgi:hypothetical protein